MRTKSFSGVIANQWRRHLAASAQRFDNTTRTLKFPLDIEIKAGDRATWDAVATLHRTVSSDQRGSLIRLIYDLLLGGFRIFGKTAETEAFRNAAVLDDAGWQQDVCAASSLTVAQKTFIPSEIYKRLLVAPRAVGGKDSGFRAEIIAIEYAKFFCNGKHSENIPDTERALFTAIGEDMAAVFVSWKAVAESLFQAAGVIDSALARLGYVVPAKSLASRIGALRRLDPAGTLAFDRDAPVYKETAGIEPHLIVARALMSGRAAGLALKPEMVKHAQAFFTGDANHGGLSWVFGKGIEFIRSSSTEDICAAFGVPTGRSEIAERVRRSALSIPNADTTLLGGKSYSSYRSGIGGMLGSWVANYIARLYSLEETLAADIAPLILPAALLADDALFEKIGTTPAEIDVLCQKALDDRQRASAALDRLMGKADGAGVDDVANLESYNTLLDTLAGLLGQVQESTKKAFEIAEATHDENAKAVLKDYAFKTPGWIRRLEKINRLNLTPVDPQAEIKEAGNEFEMLHEAMHAHYASILAWSVCTGETLSPLKRLAAQEAQHDREGKKKRNPDEQAFRLCMDRIGRAARKCSDTMLRAVAGFFEREGVFADRKHLNQFFYNRQGFLYKSPFNTGPRQPFAVTREACASAADIMTRFADFMTEQRRNTLGGEHLLLTAVIDLFRMERAHFGVLLCGFPDEIPSDLAVNNAVENVFNLPLPVQLRLANDKVSSAVMRKVFNNYYVRLESLAAILLRERFFLRAKFQRAGENALIYAPGGQLWNAPARLYASGQPIGEAMRRLERAADGQLPVDPLLALPHLLESYEDTAEPSLRAYLRQAPHDWHFPWPSAATVTGVVIDKKGCGKRMSSQPSARLIGSPAYKGILDRMLTHPHGTAVGDAALLVDRHYRQVARRRPDGTIECTAIPDHIEVNVALPITEARADPAPLPFKNYVAIDLGERGLGYAVFDAQTHTLIDKGRVKVKSMLALTMDDRFGRRKQSRAMKFKAAFDPAEERRRENVVGDFSQAINRLMWYYHAFPVLEYAAGGASSAIDKVYKAVADRYLFSQTPTVNKEREAYWKGASFWKHPTLAQFEREENPDETGKKKFKKTETTKPLSLFPGSGTSAYGTSQACSCCKRNPVEDARTLIGNDRKASVMIEEGGVVRLPCGDISLYLSAKGEERKASARKNQRTPISSPMPSGKITGDELLRLVARNLRQAPISKQVRDTHQSVYHCLYGDCREVIHSEENAAINIGTKWASERPVAAKTVVDSAA